MKKILIAISGDFLRDTYKEVFRAEGFEVFAVKNGDEAYDLIKREKVDLILIEAETGFELLEKKIDIPVIILDQYENKETRKKAIELEARDFIAFSSASPNEIVRRIKIILGEQKSYRIGRDTARLYQDMGHDGELKCPKCGSDLELNLIRDLSAGNSHFVVSFVCPNNCN